MKRIWSEIRIDFDEDGILHVDAWKNDDENSEGKVIAKINSTTMEVEYIDERAKTDEYAQEMIQKSIKSMSDYNNRSMSDYNDNWLSTYDDDDDCFGYWIYDWIMEKPRSKGKIFNRIVVVAIAAFIIISIAFAIVTTFLAK